MACGDGSGGGGPSSLPPSIRRACGLMLRFSFNRKSDVRCCGCNARGRGMEALFAAGCDRVCAAGVTWTMQQWVARQRSGFRAAAAWWQVRHLARAKSPVPSSGREAEGASEGHAGAAT